MTVLFTHDMHYYFEKFPKIKTIYDREHAENEATWLIDAGDFSMGTPYQTIYTTEASKLRMMGRVGFDVTTLGNHEFDYRARGITSMLKAALGTGGDGLAGYPLVSVYLTERELKLVAEIDIPISPLMLPARLYCSGLKYRYNEKRLILNRAYDIMLDLSNMPGLDGAPEEIDDDRLYRVVADLYSAQMLAEVNSMSKGLLSLVPKDRDGNEITDYEERLGAW